MNCNVCNKNEVEWYGRWIAWCEDCKDEGKKLDRQKIYDNELAPDIESGDFSYTLEHGLSDDLENIINGGEK